MTGCSLPDREFFENLYRSYNRYEYIHPDPLEFIYKFHDDSDREVVGLIASSLAYGKVSQILKSVDHILNVIGENPRIFLEKTPVNKLLKLFDGFKHRFTDGSEVGILLTGIKGVIKEYGSLEACFLKGLSVEDSSTADALCRFVQELSAKAEGEMPSLLPCPSRGSACKRLHLYLKWMARKDDVDPGCWKSLSPALLVMPVDTHVHNVCTRLGITSRKAADSRTAIEITVFFRTIEPSDPVKYDFAITRPGIWNGHGPCETYEYNHLAGG
jgi:uncharacterized protein (TIGR02757 family)